MTIEKLLAHLFILFFIAQIFSPSLGGKTIYLELFIAAFNPYYIFWLKNHAIHWRHISFFMALLCIVATGHIMTVLKLLMILLSVSYLFYLEDRKIKYLNFYLGISILLSILQFIFVFIDLDIAHQLGPTSIARMIWGEYGTATLTNFYTVFFFPRVSGLSREAGFFASLIVCVIFLSYLKFKRSKIKTKKSMMILLAVAYVLSFSKMSIVLLLLFLIERMRRFLQYMPEWMTVVLFSSLMCIFWSVNIDYLIQDENLTFLHRFSAYASLLQLDFTQFMIGVEQSSKVGGYLAELVSYQYESFAGFGGFLIANGIFAAIAYLIALYLYGVTSAGYLILLFLTVNVQPDTNQNFVVLAYFIVFKYYTIQRKLRIK